MFRSAVLAFLVLALGPSILSQTSPAPPLATALDALMKEEMRVSRIPGAAVAIVDNGRVVLERAYGVSNLETGTPLDVSAVFELASVTKQFTAAAIMMLVQDGKVKLDDRLSAYVGNTPAAWERITIRHLLTHTSGLQISAMPRTPATAPLLSITTPQVFEFVSQQKMQFPTGAEGWYSDAGYFLLGMVIEKASGQRYRDFLATRIFGPLRMEHSSVTDRARVIKGRVATYSLRDGEYVNWRRDWDYELPSFFGIWSTLRDVAAWDASLRQATLLERSSLAEMWTPASLENGQKARVLEHLYGFGFELSESRGRPTAGHGGASGTYLLRFLEEPLTIVLLTNLDSEGGKRHAKPLARAIAGLVRPELAPPHMLEPRTDPDERTALTIQALVADIAARRASDAMSPAYRSWYDSAPGARAWMRRQFDGTAGLRFLAADDLAGKPLWGSEPIRRLVHYAGDARGQKIYITAGMTEDGKVATLDYYLR